MSIRSIEMSRTFSPPPRRSGFLRKLVVLLAFVTGIVGFMVLLYYHQANLPPYLITIFMILMTGLSAGSGARALFFHWSGILRFFIVLLVLPVGMYLLGMLTDWQIGIGPMETWLYGWLDWYQLAQLGGGILVACLALEAWWRPGANSQERQAKVPRPGRKEAASYQASQSSAVPSGREVYQADEVPFLPKINVRFKTARKSRGRNRKSPALEKIVISRKLNKASSRSKGLFRRKPNLQISMYENHRCPYCLEDVAHNDPRGVKRCDVCNTLHHADCWEITGSCQVPHLNS
ncbi:MAG: hypothetical protein FJZ87_10485 [Chloroflexi bacterium]|nr:hypothetical protein [Chloroflexota bacterium]